MPRSVGAGVVTVNDVLDGHVGLDLECLDRIYLNAYVPMLQVGGQVVSFLALLPWMWMSGVWYGRVADGVGRTGVI